jgi:uncharacterized protein YodC (DUF2158 family)
MTFQIGDVVQLRYGGGQHMRVENAVLSEGSEWITCVWGANNDCHNYFAAEMLQRVEAKGEPPITREDIDRFRRGAQRCRAVAELKFDQGLQQEQLETALAYERMAERAERLLGLAE